MEDQAATEAKGGPPGAARLLLGAEPRYTRSEAASLAGVSEDRATRLWQSLGYALPGPDEQVFTDADIEALRTVTELHDAGLADHQTELALVRSMGQAMARLTEWQVGLMREMVIARAPDPTDGDAINEAGLAAAAELLPRVERLQQYVWRRHLLTASERVLSIGADRAEEVPLAVGFADIVGFTSLSRGLAEPDLAEFLEAFESSASAVVTDRGGRVIKMVGDEIMFSADDAPAVAEIGLGLADRISALDGRPDLRIGLAYGPVLRRLGDAYGTVVNLAARLTSLARPGTVLVDRELASALDGRPDYRVRRLRRVSVRGFTHLQPWLLRRG
ncbi:adenylate/guanylate cyclase domain-containing protein [Pseudonocardia eucalypti]|uniref:Adenylate/guanylate cyclase domain-containing protein n=1 Tax=Pseudonocardia eucalypti TaxID=648755 RepID=A0ABP9QVG4_9PSEU|nr:adenylate cyclase [Pseudonocardia eucalypti]